MNLTNTPRLLHLFLFLLPLGLVAQETVDILPGEYWWGGHIDQVESMPFGEDYMADLNEPSTSQVQPLLLSNKGRYIWHEEPFSFSVTDIQIVLEGPKGFKIGQAGNTIAEAYLYAAEHLFPFEGKTPDPMLFTHPQYNTAMELGVNQNQESILAYAKEVIEKGFPAGVITIGDNWQKDYGSWDFRKDRFPDAKKMVDELHEMGFKVMLWVCPFVSPDSEQFRMINEGDDLLLKDLMDPDHVKIVKWWNGYSALLDFTKPLARYWMKGALDQLIKDYGVDGFKFDGGDNRYYEDVIAEEAVSPIDQAALYASIGEDYALNEYGSAWKMGGSSLAQKLADRSFDWSDLQYMISGTSLQGVMGYPFVSAGTIGGAKFTAGLSTDSLDQELMVRSAQVQALMPMMQFSLAPWNALDEEHMEACKSAANIHAEFGDYILGLAGKASQSGTPIIQSMDYAYPDTGQEFNLSQFMVGSNLLVAPVIAKGETKKNVWLPPGIWLANDGKGYKGPADITVNAPIGVLPYFKRAKDSK